jgi:hypothetical protein
MCLSIPVVVCPSGQWTTMFSAWRRPRLRTGRRGQRPGRSTLARPRRGTDAGRRPPHGWAATLGTCRASFGRTLGSLPRTYHTSRLEAPPNHVRYGETSSRCYRPLVKDRAPRTDDLHRECTRSTHQSIFETALGRPIEVEVVETLRRGGRTGHFVAHVG